MNELIAIILDYESDTFDAKALKITRGEASRLARSLFADLCRIVRSGGKMYCDGVKLAERLDAMRDD